MLVSQGVYTPLGGVNKSLAYLMYPLGHKIMTQKFTKNI